jgi:hypothetical protein
MLTLGKFSQLVNACCDGINCNVRGIFLDSDNEFPTYRIEMSDERIGRVPCAFALQDHHVVVTLSYQFMSGTAMTNVIIARLKDWNQGSYYAIAEHGLDAIVVAFVALVPHSEEQMSDVFGTAFESFYAACSVTITELLSVQGLLQRKPLNTLAV